MKDHLSLLKKNFYDSLDYVFSLQNAQNDAALSSVILQVSGDKGLTDGSIISMPVPRRILAYYLEDSPYHGDESMLHAAYDALCQYEAYLHEDGSVDLLITNFHDPAQTAFHTQAIFFSTELLVRLTKHTEIEDKLFAKIQELLRKMGHAMATLGFHTPNHRWLISSALAIAYRYTGEQEFKTAIDEFLREGVDCDEYGEYTERSTGSYNLICDYAFILLGLFLDDPSFFKYPRRNLKLMYHFTEPDSTVNTLNSTRWDNGGDFNISPYYSYYLFFALLDRDPEFAYMADSIIDKYGIPPQTYVIFMITVLTLSPEMQKAHETIIPRAPEKDQTIFLPNSRIARIYKPEHNLTMTALASRSPVLFQMNWGSSILQVRFAGSFFGDPHSQFRARTIQKTADGYRLICDENAGYRSRFQEKPETSNWRKMDHSKRGIINVQNFHTEITIHILEDGATLDIETSGCELIPTKLEISMQAGGRFFTDSIFMVPKEGDYIFLREGNAEYFLDSRRYFSIEGGFCKHHFGRDMRGTMPVNPKKFTVALTEQTPQKSSVTIRAKKLY